MTNPLFRNARTNRAFRPEDLDRLLEINQACTPGVSSETRDDLAEIIALSDCQVIQEPDGRILGFITLVEPGTQAYKSPNLRWFEAWQAERDVSLIYVDRIAIAPEARGLGLGASFYMRTILQYGLRDFLVAEVNTKPDNPGSHKFHLREGFERVGEQAFSDEKAVAYYARRLTGRRDGV